VLAYVTRERNGRKELLVFDHPDADGGTQVPAGRVDPGETLEQGLLRELHEESGLEHVEVVRELPILGDWVDASPYEDRAFELRLRGEAPDAWQHVVHGTGEDLGMVFRYRWVPVDSNVTLWAGDRTYTQLR
jgi:8-oxo-dGTP pyrophosphatase MutT (NUDIX family)